MIVDDLEFEELEELLEEMNTSLGDTKNALKHLQEAINDLADIKYDGIESIYNELIELQDDLDGLKTAMESDIEDIQCQMEMIEDSMDDDPEERYKEYREMQGF